MQISSATSRRCWFRYSLRSFLIAVVVASLPLGWLAKTINRVRQQRAAIETIVASGAQYRFDYQVSAGSRPSAQPPGPWILRRFIGDDAFAYVTYVVWMDSSKAPTDGDIAALAQLPNLEWVTLFGPRVSDVSVRRLSALPNLQTLVLDGTSISNVGLASLAACPNLRNLNLAGVTDDVLRGLKHLSQVTAVGISHSPVTDAGMCPLRGLKGLEELTIVRTPSIKGAGLQYIAYPERLRVLQSAGAPIDDAALTYVARMKRLRRLTLIQTAVTDSGLKKLANLQQLTEVQMSGAAVTDAGVEHLLRSTLLRLEVPGLPITDALVPKLGELVAIELLDLSSSNVTDASMQALSKCKNLVRLAIGPHVSIEAAKRLKAELPKCYIELQGVNSSQEIKLP